MRISFKRSLTVKLKATSFDARDAAVNTLIGAGIEVAEARWNWIQVRSTTPTEIKRVLKGTKIVSITDGFRA